ncbi:MAG TPA: DUF882 domain-containing protein [Candidatus Binataceae bacterium]|nr:DUF882 domain-containing protein [Candidatus Binataceae bacterium]
MDALSEDSGRSGVITRRRLLKLGAASLATLSMPAAVIAGLRAPTPPARSLAFYNLHTGESLTTTYWEKGRYVSGALGEINYILRDFRANETHVIEPSLLDLLHALARKLDTHEPFNIISGSRSPATNAMLAARSEGVARHSLHQFGKAADIRVPGRDLATLHQVAVALHGGGVGYYPKSDFVHVDVGRVRYW